MNNTLSKVQATFVEIPVLVSASQNFGRPLPSLPKNDFSYHLTQDFHLVFW